MNLSVKSALTAGVVAASASCLVLSASVTPLPDQRASVGADYHHVVCPPLMSVTTSDVMLLAAVRSLRADASAPTLAPVPGLNSAADAIDAIYVEIEKWVRYGFEVAADIVAWIPWVGIFANQIMVVYNFVESLINSGVFNTTDWFRGEGSVLKNVADWVVDLGLALVWLGIDEVGAWIPLPPLGWYPPRPPVADLPEGSLGDAVVGASHLLADVSNAIWNVWEPIEGGIDWAVSGISGLLNAVSWIPFVPLIDMEIVEGWNLIAGEIDALTGFAHDMINAGDQFVTDTIQGDGLIAAIVNATNTTLESIGTRGGEAIQALVDWVNAQIEFFLDPFAPDEAGLSPAVEATSATGEGETVTTSMFAPGAELDRADAVKAGDDVVVNVSAEEHGTETEQQTESAVSEPEGETDPPVGDEETPTADLEGEGDDAGSDIDEETVEAVDISTDDAAEIAETDGAADDSPAGDTESDEKDATSQGSDED